MRAQPARAASWAKRPRAPPGAKICGQKFKRRWEIREAPGSCRLELRQKDLRFQEVRLRGCPCHLGSKGDRKENRNQIERKKERKMEREREREKKKRHTQRLREGERGREKGRERDGIPEPHVARECQLVSKGTPASRRKTRVIEQVFTMNMEISVQSHFQMAMRPMSVPLTTANGKHGPLLMWVCLKVAAQNRPQSL